MKQASDVLPWKTTDISVYPYGADLWSMNPSIHLDRDGTWRCVTRIVDYSMPNGVTVRSKNAGMGQQTKNAMLILDPTSWKPIQIFRMHERDNLPRTSTPHRGFEDMRIFRTDTGGLQGIAASLHLQREERTGFAKDESPQYRPPEQVILSFDSEYNVISVKPIRGDRWSGPQKNWVPYNDCVEPRFLYSIDKGSVFDDCGPVHGDAARVRPSVSTRFVVPIAVTDMLIQQHAESPQEQEQGDRSTRPKKSARRATVRGGSDVRIVRGGRIKLDTITSRPSAQPSSRSSTRVPMRSTDDSMRVMGSGRMLKYNGLRGGSQLVRVGDDAWLGIGHEMSFVTGKKHYWHTFYLVDSRGKMTAASEPIKLAPNGIEFAAGMAIDGDRVVVSFGVDDMNSMLGETSLSAVMEMLRPVER